MLGYSTGSLPASVTATQEGPQAIARALAFWLLPTPFRGVEFVVRPEHLQRCEDEGFWRALRVGLEAKGLQVRNVHLGYPYLLGEKPHRPGLSALVPEQRRLRREAALAAARIAIHLGSPNLTVTTGPAERSGGEAVMPGSAFAKPWPTFAAGALSPDFREQWQVVQNELGVLVASKPAGLHLLIEQEPEMAVHSAEQLAALARQFEGEVFANYDVGHGAVIGEDIPAALTLLKPYLRNVHLEDIAGGVHRHLLFGEGAIDFQAIFSTLRQHDYAGDLTPDLYPFSENPGEALVASAAFLRQHGWVARGWVA